MPVYYQFGSEFIQFSNFDNGKQTCNFKQSTLYSKLSFVGVIVLMLGKAILVHKKSRICKCSYATWVLCNLKKWILNLKQKCINHKFQKTLHFWLVFCIFMSQLLRLDFQKIWGHLLDFSFFFFKNILKTTVCYLEVVGMKSASFRVEFKIDLT